MKTSITPTIGRKVWFWPNGVHIGPPGAAQPQQFNTEQALDATIVFVWGDRINGMPLHIGTFEIAEQAHAAYLDVKRQLHPGNTL